MTELFSDETLDLKSKLQRWHVQLSSFPLATRALSTISRATSKSDKLPLETEPVRRENSTTRLPDYRRTLLKW